MKGGIACTIIFFATLFSTQGRAIVPGAFEKDSIHIYYIVDSIIVRGNHRVRRDVIIRESDIQPGNVIRDDDLPERMAGVNHYISNLALFLSVKITDSITSANHLYLIISVKERFFIYGGLNLTITDRNFSEWLRHIDLYRVAYGGEVTLYNFRNQNELLDLAYTTGWRHDYLVRYKNPYLNKSKSLGLYYTAEYQDGHEVGVITEHDTLNYLKVDQGVIFKKFETSLTLTYRPKIKMSQSLTIDFENYAIGDTIARYSNPNYLGDGRTSLRTLHLEYNFTYDNRDYFFYPLNGSYLNISVDKNGLGVIYNEVNITTLLLNFKEYDKLGNNFYYAGGLLLKKSFSPDPLPYVYTLPIGYRSEVRGYEYYLVNGDAMALFNNEMKWQIFSHSYNLDWVPVGRKWNIRRFFTTVPITVYFKIYCDEGYVHNYPRDATNSLQNQLLTGYGAGFDIITYYDKIMRIEYSFNNLGQSGLYLSYVVPF